MWHKGEENRKTKCVLVGKPEWKKCLENPGVKCDDKTTHKMDLISAVGECGLNSSAPEASGGPMPAAEWK